MRAVVALSLCVALQAAASAPPEVQLALMHLRSGERERAVEALGPLDRLPLYLAELDVDPKARTVSARVRLRLIADAHGLREVLLRATPNAISPLMKLGEVKVNGEPATVEQQEPTLFRILPARAAAPDEELTVSFTVSAKVPRAEEPSGSLMGLMPSTSGARGDHGAFSAAPDVMSLAGILPGLVPRDSDGEPLAGPTGIGDLGLYVPANYLVSISVPSAWKAVATGVALGEVPERSGKTRFSFGAAAVRDFPVLATRGFEVLTGKAGDIAVEAHVSAKHKPAAKHALKMAIDSLEALEERLGPLPWKVFRVVEAPLSGGAGGMEFPGLVTLARSLYEMATPGASPALRSLQQLQEAFGSSMPQSTVGSPLGDLEAMFRTTLEFTVAHEVAHQYFAGLVGSDPVAHPVVDEALAQHTALLLMEWKRGRKTAESIRDSQLKMSYQLYRMSGGEDGPADRPTGDFDNELEYGALVYGKAPLLHDAQRKLLGDKAYFAALRGYVQRYRHRWAEPDAFTETLARASPDNAAELRKLSRRWLSQAYGDEDLGTTDLKGLLGATGASIPPEAMELLQQLLQGQSP